MDRINYNTTDNVAVFYDRYKEELDRYKVPFEEIRDIFYKNFDKYPLKNCLVPGGLIMKPDKPNYNKEKGAFDDYFFTTNYDSKHVHIKSVIIDDDLKDADCIELWNGFDCYTFGSDTNDNIIYNRIYVGEYRPNYGDIQVDRNVLFVENYYYQYKTSKTYSLDIYSNYDIKYFHENIAYRIYNKEADEFMDKLAALNIEPAVSLSIVKDDNKYNVYVKYNDPKLLEIYDCTKEELKIEDTVPVDDSRSNYDQVTAISKLYYENFIKPTINMTNVKTEHTK